MWLMGVSMWALPAFGQKGGSVEVARAVESFRNVLITPDKAKLEEVLSEQLSYGHSGGRIENRDQCIENLLNGNSDFVSIDLTDQTIICIRKTAVVRHDLFAKTNDKGVPGQVRLHVMTTWVKEGKQWKLLARQAVKI